MYKISADLGGRGGGRGRGRGRRRAAHPLKIGAACPSLENFGRFWNVARRRCFWTFLSLFERFGTFCARFWAFPGRKMVDLLGRTIDFAS